MYESRFLIQNKYKKTFCKFCEYQIVSKHFVRHLENKHGREKEVIQLNALPKNSKDADVVQRRKNLITILRNDGNLESASRGQIIPKRLPKGDIEVTADSHFICVSCKSYFKKGYLYRHRKKCFANNENHDNVQRKQHIIESLIYVACEKKYGSILAKMQLKDKVLRSMRGDNVAQVILDDLLIIRWGEDLLKRAANNRSCYHLSAKMRRCAKFLIAMRKISPNYTNMLSCLLPEAFDDVIHAVKDISAYDPEKRQFKAPSTALQFGAYLKQISDMSIKLVMRKHQELSVKDRDKCIKELEMFKELVSSQWSIELASLALKDLNKKASKKPPLIPLTEDIMKLTKYTHKCAEEAYAVLMKNRDDKKMYAVLAESAMVSAIIHNRKRAGDVHYFELDDYMDQKNSASTSRGTQTEFLDSLTQSEKMLMSSYVKLNSTGKGSRNVPVLVPQARLKYYDLLYKIRNEQRGKWFPTSNVYFFTLPHSTRWLCGVTAIRKYAKASEAKHPDLLTTTRLRKQIATVTQLLSLRENEVNQLATFLGHTSQTFQKHYRYVSSLNGWNFYVS